MNPLDEHVLNRLHSYLDRTLSLADSNAVRRHCDRCPSCKAALESAAASGQSRGGTPGPARSARHPSGHWGQFSMFYWPTLALAAALLAVLSIHYTALEPSPFDLRVLGQSEWMPGTDAAIHLQVLRHDHKPERGVPVTVELTDQSPGAGRRVQLTKLTTGDLGAAVPRFRLPDWPDGPYQLQVTASPPGTSGPETVTQTVRLKHSWRLLASTDKPVYQPGQVIHMRGLALRRPDLKPVAGQVMAFSVTDPRGNVVFRDNKPTSRFGIGSADCPLAGEVSDGSYQVDCRVGETTSRSVVEVKKYVLPRFRVALVLDKPYYQPGQTIKGRVQADYVFGKPVSEAAVTVKLESTDVGPLGPETCELRTDSLGAAAFQFVLPGALISREQGASRARVVVVATVRDPSGQTQERSERRIVASDPIQIEVIPETPSLVQYLTNTIHVLTTTIDGRPVRTSLSIPGFDRTLQTGELGVASFAVAPMNPSVTLIIQAVDEQGRTGRRQVDLRCSDVDGDYLVRTNKAVFRGGEPIDVEVLAIGDEPVFLDLIKDGQTVVSESIAIAQGRGECRIDAPRDLFGTVFLHAYRHGPTGMPVRVSRVIQIRPARALAIKMSADRPEYRPGERASLALALTDENGAPAPGAISVAAVDEAVFGVLDRRPGLERPFHSLEHDLLEPESEIDDWSSDGAPFSDLVRAAPLTERGQLEQALFARSARGPEETIGASAASLGSDRELGRAIRVLDRPDWEQLAGAAGLSAGLVEQLRRAAGPHSLVLSSYSEKLSKVLSIRRTASDRLGIAWLVVIIASVAGVLAWAAWNRKTPIGTIVFIVITLGIMVALMLPAVQSARESARKAQAMNELKQMGMAAATAVAPSEPVRVRKDFRETLIWRPEIITDDQGRARLDVDLADSITTWRVALGAVSAGGSFGAAQAALRVFQPFFVDLDLPSALTRGDEVGIPVVVSNYLDKPQTVSVALADGPWFERLEATSVHSIELKPNEVRSLHFAIRAKAVGHQEIQITARGSERGVADAVRRTIEVVPEGRPIEHVASGTLERPAEVDLVCPENAIPGSVRAIVKIYPSTFSQLVEGLDAIFHLPYGCFEQASSTTYPNVLALDYLRRTGKSAPQVEATARQFINLGYQQLVTFEIKDGGFDWFGHSPANRALTAYGLMEFQDMAKVHDVDPNLIARTRRWLLAQQQADGSWEPEGHSFHGGPAEWSNGPALARLSTTAYIAWSVFSGQAVEPASQATRAYLEREAVMARDDPYVLALVANALLAIDRTGAAARPHLERLTSLRQTSNQGKLVWWGDGDSDSVSKRTLFFGSGPSRRIETTALAALALANAGQSFDSVRGALAWLIAAKDGQGTWASTQATVLALKALLAGTGKPLGGDKPRRIVILLDGEIVQELAISADQADVVRQVDLSDRIAKVPGTRRLTIEDRSGTDSCYQVVFRYHEPDKLDRAAAKADGMPFTISLHFDRTLMAVDETATAVVSVVNNRPEPAPMVILDLPIPAGFAIDGDELAALVDAGSIEKFQVSARAAIVYLRDLKPGVLLTVRYRLRATMPVKLAVPPARVYEYYDPSREGSSRSVGLLVTAKR